jgi:hypothetical protein
MEFLIDRSGYLRARWIPGGDRPGWSDIKTLVAEILGPQPGARARGAARRARALMKLWRAVLLLNLASRCGVLPGLARLGTRGLATRSPAQARASASW